MVPYDLDTQFHEPFVLFGFLAACTTLELATGILILPQRQTVLVAKQAAQVDVLTNGDFRLGVGIGWNPVEYEALGQDFTQRGRRVEEQVQLLRRLWTERSVTSAGVFDQITGAGLAPLPVQRPIPVWFGGMSERAFESMGRLADGWFPWSSPARSSTRRSRRSPAGRGRRTGPVRDQDGGPRGLARRRRGSGRRAEGWRAAGASHLSINTMGAGLESAEDHLAALATVALALELA